MSQISGLKSSVSQQTRKLADAQAASSELNQVLKADKERVTLEKALSDLMLVVFNRRIEHGVSVAYATPAKLGAGGAMSALTAISEEVPGTKGVKSVRVNISGTYTSYLGLLGYLQDLQQGSAAIVRLQVRDQTFEVSLRVYGNE